MMKVGHQPLGRVGQKKKQLQEVIGDAGTHVNGLKVLLVQDQQVNVINSWFSCLVMFIFTKLK